MGSPPCSRAFLRRFRGRPPHLRAAARGLRRRSAMNADPREAELAPESILPCQLGDSLFGMARLQPEKRLQLAVLQDAILTFHRLVGVGGHRPRRLFGEVDEWFASDDASPPFAFVAICDTLNLDADYIRRGLEMWRERTGVAIRRPPFRRDSIGTRHRVVERPLRRSA